MDLSSFTGGAGLASQGATAAQQAGIQTAGMQLGLQQQQLQTRELQEQYDALNASRDAFRNAPDTQTAFNNAAAAAFKQGNPDLGASLLQKGIEYQGNGLKHVTMQALTGADPATIESTWNSYFPGNRIDQGSMRPATAEDAQANSTIMPGDYIYTSNGQPGYLHTKGLGVMFGMIPRAHYEASRGTNPFLFETTTGQVTYQTPQLREYTSPDGEKIPLDWSDPNTRQWVDQRLLATMQPGTISRKVDESIFKEQEGLRKSQFTALSPEDQTKFLQSHRMATWLYANGRDEFGKPFTPGTALEAADEIQSGKKNAFDYGIYPPGVTPRPQGGKAPEGHPDAKLLPDQDDQGKYTGQWAWFDRAKEGDKDADGKPIPVGTPVRVGESMKGAPVPKAAPKAAQPAAPAPNAGRSVQGKVRQPGEPVQPQQPAPRPAPAPQTPAGLGRVQLQTPTSMQGPAITGLTPQPGIAAPPVGSWVSTANDALRRSLIAPPRLGPLEAQPLPRREGGLVRARR